MRALATGVSGLMAHQKALDNIGNNLANINTVGFKKGVYQFTTLLEQSLSGAMQSDGVRGSINPVSIGLGTQTGSVSKIHTQGTLDTTGAVNDFALYGNGFFVLSTGTGGYAYTRDGSFSLDENNNLVSGSTGYYIQGTMAIKNSDGSISIPQDSRLQNITISLGSIGGMSRTSQVGFTGNLNSDQQLATGLRLFGSKFPTVNDLQSWMPNEYNTTDTTWKALEEATYVISQETLDYWADQGFVLTAPLASNITVYTGGFAQDMDTGYTSYAIDVTTGEVVDVRINGEPVRVDTLSNVQIPCIQEIKTINGGNVQTSMAMGVEVPDFLSINDEILYNGQYYTITNEYTYPPWFYDANGGDFTAMIGPDNTDIQNDPDTGWPFGFQGTSTSPTAPITSVSELPRMGEVYPATLNTPLGYIKTSSGNGTWNHLFPGIVNGDEITLSFDKGSSTITATFTYKEPANPLPFGNQQRIDNEQSYTLEHLLKFMAGDVDKTGTCCPAITPSMFGAPVTAEYPYGDPTDVNFDEDAYNRALSNYALATSDSNFNDIGGVMGLIDVAPLISSQNGGTDTFDSPIETAGAFTREGVSEVKYKRWDAIKGDYVDVSAPSFNISILSNLGSENSISNISMLYKNVNKSIFTEEKEYSAPQGGSSTATITLYDSLGNPKTATIRLAMVSQDDNFTTWRWYVDCEDDTDFGWIVDPESGEIVSSLNVGTGLIRFDANGNFVQGCDYSETGGITINQANQGVDDPIIVKIINGLTASAIQDLDFSDLTFSNSANSFTLASQNGTPPGTLDSYTVATDGTIYGVYSTGVVVPIARMVLATIPNTDGLLAVGDNLYYTTPASGDAIYGYAETGGRASVRQYQLERSNVDLSEEFTNMISIERGYQANSRIITTADNMLQELLQMVR